MEHNRVSIRDEGSVISTLSDLVKDIAQQDGFMKMRVTQLGLQYVNIQLLLYSVKERSTSNKTQQYGETAIASWLENSYTRLPLEVILEED